MQKLPHVHSTKSTTLFNFTKVKLALLILPMLAVGLIYSSTSVQAAACTPPTTDLGSVTSTINISTSGTYRIWSRIMTGTAATDNSYLLEVDGTSCYTVGDNNAIPASTWTWVDYQNGTTTSKLDINLTAGAHTIKMIGKEENVQIDRLIATNDGCTPTGTGDNCVFSSDTTPPTVSLTAPAGSATVSGPSVAVSASASDDTGVTGVQFKLDGSNLSSEDTTSPYSINWDTTAVANGTHTLTAVARDGAGHSTASTAVTVTVNNTVAPGNLNVGETTILPSDDSGNANTLLAQQATLSQSAAIQSMSFYVTVAAGNLRMGIYDATGPGGGPGAKVAETSEITPVVGWNTANTTAHPTLAAGTYWLAYLPSSNALQFKEQSTGSTKQYGFTYGTLPATFSTAPTSLTAHWSLYASFTTGSSSTKTGDLNGDNVVNIFDLSILLSNYGKAQSQSNNAKTDLNNDGTINIFDLSILLSNYGK
jgi:hypothetical protein